MRSHNFSIGIISASGSTALGVVTGVLNDNNPAIGTLLMSINPVLVDPSTAVGTLLMSINPVLVDPANISTPTR